MFSPLAPHCIYTAKEHSKSHNPRGGRQGRRKQQSRFSKVSPAPEAVGGKGTLARRPGQANLSKFVLAHVRIP